MSLMESLKWRYATKKFDSNKKVNQDDLSDLKESIRLAATSYGLQPFKVLVVSDQNIKDKLVPATFGQSQVSDCSHVFIFAYKTDMKPEYIDKYINLCASERNLKPEDLKGYSSFMKKTLGGLSNEQVRVWGSKQAYIGMANLLTACADMRIDACPIEGFSAKTYNELFNLDKDNLSACVVVAVGYRAEDCPNQHLKKVRLPSEDLFI
ncbi:MAG: NAD(P)H-dependent oxidoreductase [Crocinitomicaceae bacterium]